MAKNAYVFSQFLGLLSRYEFQMIVNKYNGDYRTKHFKCWHQLTCMMFAPYTPRKKLTRPRYCFECSCKQAISYWYSAMP